MAEKSGPQAHPSQRAAIASSSLNNLLDQERAASMADEGGAAGAEMESQETENRRPGLTSLPPYRPQERPKVPHLAARGTPWVWIAGAGLIGVVALYFVYRDRLTPALKPE